LRLCQEHAHNIRERDRETEETDRVPAMRN